MEYRKAQFWAQFFFLLYINDLWSVSNVLKFVLFADDTNIFCNRLARNPGLASATTNVTTRKIVKSNLPQNRNIDVGGDVDGNTTHPFWKHARAKAARNDKRADGGNTQNNGRERPTHTSRSQPQQRANAESCEYCAEPGHFTRDCGFRDFATCRQCGQQDQEHKFCGRYRY